MDYTLEHGLYFKVIDDNGKIILFGKMDEESFLSTESTVEFISEDDYNTLRESANNKPVETE
ncbi:hypothetical protein [Elizabethkingia anophelis]|uniref:hypothetical protein n=1 Tax=Elizabethkingia anophelis TaxID=1117645 RepID=UPI00099AE5D5|nr:hypothetical protein [Elizabethkingia anophelis]OPC44609.1 hypothetical protein BAY05_13945 [Elizabethkingia anophelis]